MKRITLLLAALPFAWAIPCGIATLHALQPASAQSIVPATDGTGTVVTPNGNRFNISGGSTSKDGTNLFHSFTQFGLDRSQIANFLSNPAIKNILGRVTGGNASVINGLIQITGSNANLFLINPAGILFGPNASLNVPASFTATTASRIGFDSGWLNAVGANNYAALVGTPSAFSFNTSVSGAIVNFGNLAVPEGHNITLLGGTVINTGTLSASGGNITVAAVPNSSIVRIAQPGHLLSLEVDAEIGGLGENTSLTPVSLPKLLTGGNFDNATGLSVASDGTVQLEGSGIRVENGDAIVSGTSGGSDRPYAEINSSTATLFATRNLILEESRLVTRGDLNLRAGDTVTMLDSAMNPFVAIAGGNLSIQGDKGINILAINHPETTFQSQGNFSLTSDSLISTDAHFTAGGNFSILNTSGQPANFVSLSNPAIVSRGNVIFGDYTGPSLQVEAAGSIAAGNLTVSNFNQPITHIPTLILTAGKTFDSNGVSPTSNIQVKNITINPLSQSGPVILEAFGNIQTGSITSNGGEIYLKSSSSIDTSAGTLNSAARIGNSGAIALSAKNDIIAGSLNSSSTDGTGGNITLYSESGVINSSRLNSNSVNSNAGIITVYSAGDGIRLGDLNAASINGNGGLINIYSQGDIATTDINSMGSAGGEIKITSSQGNINTSAGKIVSSGGAIALHPAGNLTTGNITSNGGDINLTSNSAINTVAGTLDSAGGNITLYATDTITTADIITAGGYIDFLTRGAIDTSAGTLNSSSISGNGGAIVLSANDDINAGVIDSHSESGNGGHVTLASTISLKPASGLFSNPIASVDAPNISIKYINAQGSSTGLGGDVSIISANYFRASDTFIDQNGIVASISTAGGRGESAISIAIGLQTNAPLFTVGDATTNGTAGALTNGWISLKWLELDNAVATFNSSKDKLSSSPPGSSKDKLPSSLPESSLFLNAIVPKQSFEEFNQGLITIFRTIQGSTSVGEIPLPLPEAPVAIALPVIQRPTIPIIEPLIPPSSGEIPEPLPESPTVIQPPALMNVGEALIGEIPAPIPESPIIVPVPVAQTPQPAPSAVPVPVAQTPQPAPSAAPVPVMKTPQPAPSAAPTPPMASQPPPPVEIPNSPLLNPQPQPNSQPAVNDPLIPQNINLVNQELTAVLRPTADSGREIFPAEAIGELTISNCFAAELRRDEVSLRKQFLSSQVGLKEAMNCSEQTLAIAPSISDRRQELLALQARGVEYYKTGNYAKAIEFYQQSLTIANEKGDRRFQGEAEAGLGATYGAIGNYNKAIESYQKSLAIAREVNSPESEGIALRNLGLTYLSMEDYEKAIDYQHQSLAISEKLGDKRSEGLALSHLGFAYLSRGDNAKAIEYLQSSLALAREKGDRDAEGRSLGNLGWAYYGLGDFFRAIDYHQQHLAIAQESRDRPSIGQALNNLGDALFKAGKPQQATDTLLASIQIWESLRAGLGKDDANKISIFDRQSLTYTTLQQVLISQNQFDAALEIAERGKARAFIELLAKKLQTQDGRDFQSSNLQPPNISQIQQIAKQQNATIVEYSIITEAINNQKNRQVRDSEIYIWVINPNGNIAFRKVDLKPLWQKEGLMAAREGLDNLDDRHSLANLVASSRESIGAGGRGISAIARINTPNQPHRLQQLYQLLIQPIADLLPNNPDAPVILIPHEELFLVPFAALIDANGKYLIEKHTILTAPSIQVLEFTRRQRNKIASLGADLADRRSGMQTSQQNPSLLSALVVGNPTMPSISPAPGLPMQPLPPLPGAEKEARAIAQLLGVEALLGDRASKASILQKIPEARIIHLATHGLLEDFGTGVPGAIALAPTAEDNGWLSAREILDLHLNAELVVLSACDTGRGRITGDGVIGLSRSFISTGVPSVIVSLWAVPDAPTAALMTEFYHQLQQTSDKAKALRNATLKTMKEHPNPRDWAAFTLIGEGK